MFRIKTDIRQYKCESREKVERLIRNWVIRPTDLIFDQDEQAWAPIGEHDIFAATFAEMANREQMGADTVVSPHPPEAMEDEEEDVEAGEEGSREERDEDSPEDEAEDPVGETDEPPAEALSEEDRHEETTEPGADVLPDGELSAAASGDRETIEDTRPQAERPEAVGATEQVGAGAGQEPADGSGEYRTTTEESVEPTVELERSQAAESSDFVESADSGEFETETPTGRHDLPEDIFATNEIAGSLKRENVQTIDELGEEDGEDKEDSEDSEAVDSDEDYDVQEVEEALQREREQRARHRDDDEWNEILDRLRETDELSKEDLEEITRTTDQIAIGRDEAEDGEQVRGDVEEYVSEGYTKELPIRIGPTREDIDVGLRPSNASEARKNRVFPYPEPKRKGEVERRVFRLRPPADHSLKFILSVVGVVLVLIVTAVVVF